MATIEDDGFHEIQLGAKQLVFLFMAATVVSVVIFLCGVLVGRGLGPGSGPGEALSAQAADEVIAAEAPPPPVAISRGADAPASSTEDLSYPERLGAAELPAERLPDSSRSGRPAAAPPPSIAPRAEPEPAAEAVPDVPVAATAAVSGEPPGVGFAIQITALSQRAEAEGVARRLAERGYPAYVLTPEDGAPAVFRVRVGKFKDRREAESVAARLEKEEQLKPWIVR